MAKDLKVGNPWLTMWTKPRQTIREIVSTNPKYRFALLSAVYGFPMLLNFAQTLSLGMNVHWGMILAIAVVLSTFVGMLGLSITAGLMYWTGKWIGGKSQFLEMRAAVSWANVTNVVTSLVWLVLIAIFGQDVFMRNFSNTPFMGGEKVAIFFLFTIQTIVSIWSIFILVKAVGEVQGFSAWKGLLNLILPVMIVILLAWGIGLVVGCSVSAPPQL